MKKQVTRLLLIIMLAVLFVPLFSDYAFGIEYTTNQKWISYPDTPISFTTSEYMYQAIVETDTDTRLVVNTTQLNINQNGTYLGYASGGQNVFFIYENGEWTEPEFTGNISLKNINGSPRVEAILQCNDNIIDDRFEDRTDNKGGVIKYATINRMGEEIIPPPDYEKGFDEDGYGIRFLLPRNGFKDNSYLFTYYIEYRFPAFLRDLSIRVDGDYIAGTGKQEQLIFETEPDNSVNGTIKFTVGHEIGLNTIRAYAKYLDGSEFGYEAFRQIERLGGFIDEDGDGIDDRTGRPDNNEEKPWYNDDYNPDDGKPNRDEYGTDIIGTVSYYFDTLIYWLLSPFRLIADGLQSLLTTVTDTFGWAGNFSNMMGGLFSFLPDEITGMITLAFTSLIVFTIIKVVRK